MCAMVGALVADRELADLVTMVARNMGEEVPCVETSPEGLVGALRMMEPHGVRALISSGRLFEILKTATTLPVIPCNPSSFDLLLALNRAKPLSSKIALLHFGGLPINIREIEDALQVSIGEFVSGRSAQEVRGSIEQVKAAGYTVLVSGQAPASIARGYGLSTVAIKAGTVTVADALTQAVSTVRTQQSTDDRTIAFQAAAETAGVGLLVSSRDGKIIMMNSLARELTGVPVAEEAHEVFGESSWQRLLAGGPAPVIFGRNRLLAESRTNLRWKDVRVISIMDPPLLRRLMAVTSDEVAAKTDATTFNDVIAASLNMGGVLARAMDLSRDDHGVIIYGEPGSGKTTIAQAIHSASRRGRAPFVRINAMLSDESVLADLLGSCVAPDEPSLIERAHGGTVYVHECYNLSPNAQRVLLEALERKSVRRYDGARVPCDVRVILGSTRPLRDIVESGRLIGELYNLAAAQVLKIPPLRDRQEDVVPLITEFLKREGVADVSLSQSLQRRLVAQRWPGNCVDLRNFASRLASLHRAFPSASRPMLEKTAFEEMESEAETKPAAAEEVLILKPGSMEFLEEQILEQMDKLVGGNKSELARRLNISRTTLWKKLKQDDIQVGTE